MKLFFLGILCLAVLFEVAGDVLFKKWAIENRQLLLGMGLALYFIASGIWAYSLKFESLSKAATMFTVLNSVLVVLAGVLIFNDALTVWNKIGIGLGILSVFLLQ